MNTNGVLLDYSIKNYIFKDNVDKYENKLANYGHYGKSYKISSISYLGDIVVLAFIWS